MSQLLKQSTAFTFRAGPFVDSTDGVTAETGLTIAQADIQISKNGGAFAQTSAGSPTTTHDADGWYQCPLTATDTGTLGTLRVQITMAGALPVWENFTVVPANVYDSLIAGSDNLQVDTTQIEGSNATDQINTACDTALTDYDAPTKAELDSGFAALNDLSAADVNAQVDTALADIGLDHLLAASVAGTDVTDNSVFAKLVSKSATADWDDFNNTTDSLQATSDSGNAFFVGAGELGDYAEDATVEIQWMSYNKALTASTASSATISVYKDGGGTPSTAGVGTPTYDLNSVTGLNEVTLDTSSDAFYSVGSDFCVYCTATVDGQTVTGLIAYFSIENRVSATAGGLTQADVRTAVGLASANLDIQLAAIDTVVDSILVDTAEIGVAGAGLTALASASSISALNDLSTTEVAGAVLNAATSSYNTPLSIGWAIQQANTETPLSAAEAQTAAEAAVNAVLTVSGGGVLVTALADDVITAASIADNALTSAAFAASALDDKGNWNVGKTGYSISGSITTLDGLNDLSAADVNAQCDLALSDYDPPTKAELDSGLAALNDISVTDILTTTLADAYAAHGNAPTLQQAIMWIHQHMDEKAISGTTMTVKKIDGTTAGTLTLDSSSAPTSVTRAT